MRILFSLLLIVLFAGNTCSSQAKRHEPSQMWIERLKNTPVAQMEAGLPESSFAGWFADIVKPLQAEYEVKACQETNSPDASTRLATRDSTQFCCRHPSSVQVWD